MILNAEAYRGIEAELGSHCQHPHSADQPIQGPLDRLELGNPASLALDMLAKRTKRREPHMARGQGAEIHLVLMTGAIQVLVQGTQ